ncbi:MAG: bifunctional UDP-N-acetylglucosamine diphosphorylase/glucosamine-1-phosphate N-acetyltransferase GlmU [Solirubrobacterales bacterium]
MAGGGGPRMRPPLPKVLHLVCGRPMVVWPVIAADRAGIGRIVVVVPPGSPVGEVLPDEVETVVQEGADGTGGAVRAAGDAVSASDEVVVLSGDVPLVSPEVIGGMLAAHRDDGAEVTVLTTVLEDPGTYGRVVRTGEGTIERIVETKVDGDASPEELGIREVNSGTYVFKGEALAGALEELDAGNAQGELYLTDAVAAIARAGGPAIAYTSEDHAVNLGVNDRADLAAVEAEARRRIAIGHMEAGVTVVDPGSTWIDADVTIGEDARIEPGTSLRGATEVGGAAVIGPGSTISDSGIGARSEVIHSVLNLCEVAEDCRVGPFCHLRPGAALANGAKAGTFVEVKNAELGEGAKVPHLSYVGDAGIGARANLGAGTITANYDGVRKNRTVIGPDAMLGVDTMLVAPVEVGEGARTGAGAVIREDVPPGSLAVSENLQRNIGPDDAGAQGGESTESDSGE